jgi:hypothetical protein
MPLGVQQSVIAGALGLVAGYQVYTTVREAIAAKQAEGERERVAAELRAAWERSVADTGAAAAARRTRRLRDAAAPTSEPLAFQLLRRAQADAVAELRDRLTASQASALLFSHVPILGGHPTAEFGALYALALLGNQRLFELALSGLAPRLFDAVALTHPFGLGLRVLDADAAREVGRTVARLAATPVLTLQRADGGVLATSDAIAEWYASQGFPRGGAAAGQAAQPLLDALHEPAVTLRSFVVETLERGQPYSADAWEDESGTGANRVLRPASNHAWACAGLAGGSTLPLYAALLVVLPDDAPGTLAAFTDLAASVGVYARSIHSARLGLAFLQRRYESAATVVLASDDGNVPHMGPWLDLRPMYKPGTVLLTTWDTAACGLEARNVTYIPATGAMTVILTSIDNQVRPLPDQFRGRGWVPPKGGRKGGRRAPEPASKRPRGVFDGEDGRLHLWAPPPPSLNSPEAVAAAGEDLASRIAARQLGRTLLSRVGGERGAAIVGSSLEHAVALSGIANGAETPLYDTVCGLRDEAGGALAGEGRDAVASALTQTLTAVVPPPEPPAGTPPSAVASLGQALLSAEVASFVGDLLEVLRLLAASVPVNAAGRTPLDACHASDARDEAWARLLVPIGTPITLRNAVRRTQARRECERVAASALSPSALPASYALVALGALLLLWASYGAAAAFLPVPMAAAVALLSTATGVSGVLTALTGMSSHALAADPEAYTARVVRPLHSFYLAITGRPRALVDAQQAALLRARCEALVRVWGVRRLKAHLERAVNKPALTAREVEQLTDEIVAVVSGATAAAGDAGVTRTLLTPAQAALEGVTPAADGGGAAQQYVAVEGALPEGLGPLLEALGERPVDEDEEEEEADEDDEGDYDAAHSVNTNGDDHSPNGGVLLRDIVADALDAAVHDVRQSRDERQRQQRQLQQLLTEAPTCATDAPPEAALSAAAPQPWRLRAFPGRAAATLRRQAHREQLRATSAALRGELATAQHAGRRTAGRIEDGDVEVEGEVEEGGAGGDAAAAGAPAAVRLRSRLRRDELPRGSDRRKVAAILRAAGLTLVRRTGGHLFYRLVVPADPEIGRPARTVPFTASSTPSDVRAGRHEEATLRRLLRDTGVDVGALLVEAGEA